MPTAPEANSPFTIVFTGDSVTDCGRREPGAPPLGTGYVARIAEALATSHPSARVVNTGINGNRSSDLLARWQTDVRAHEPALISVLVGINDVWRRFDQGLVTTPAEYGDNLRAMLMQRTAPVVLLTPFLTPVTEEQRMLWQPDLDAKLVVLRAVAQELDVALIDTASAMTAAAEANGAAAIAADGVHPTPLGHDVLAQSWLAAGFPTASQSATGA